MHNQIASRNNSTTRDGLWKTLKQPEIWKPLAIINAFFAFQQFSGTFVIIVYATQFASTGIDKFLVTVLIGFSRVIATLILAFFILDKYGRKPPSIFSGIGESFLVKYIIESFSVILQYCFCKMFTLNLILLFSF